MIYKIPLSAREILEPARRGPNQGQDRSTILDKKIRNGDDIILVGQEAPVKINPLDERQRLVLLAGTRSELRDLRFTTIDGAELRLTHLAKTEDFGGMGSRYTKENQQVSNLNSEIQKAFRDTRKPLTVKLGPYVFENVVGAGVLNQKRDRDSGRLPKADVALVNTDGHDVAWFSLKSNRYNVSNPTDTQQYSGISESSGIHISEADETKDFVRFVRDSFPDGVPEKTTLSRDIESESLKLHAVFGSDSLYEDYGPNKCHAVVHGVPFLTKRHDGYELDTYGEIFLFGQVPDGGYTPTLMAYYRSDRNTAGIPKTRITIYPRGGRKAEAL